MDYSTFEFPIPIATILNPVTSFTVPARSYTYFRFQEALL